MNVNRFTERNIGELVAGAWYEIYVRSWRLDPHLHATTSIVVLVVGGDRDQVEVLDHRGLLRKIAQPGCFTMLTRGSPS